MTLGLPLRFAGPSGVTNFFQVTQGGGGFQSNIAQSPDGTWQLLMGNTPNLYGWYSNLNSGAGAWVNLSASPYMDSLGLYLGSYQTPSATAIAPDNQTAYHICNLIGADNRLGFDNQNGGINSRDCGQLYKTTDKGQTWHRADGQAAGSALQTGMGTIGNAPGTVNYGGRFMRVDPQNKNVVVWLDTNGFPFITFNGGVTIHPLLNLATQAMYNCRAAADATVGSNKVITVGSNPINGINPSGNFYIGVYDYDHPFALGCASLTNNNYEAFTGDATHFTVQYVQKNNGGLGVPGDAGVVGGNGSTTGDRLFIGRPAFVEIDGTSTLVANPGIALGDPGIPNGDTCSSVMYFCWGLASSQKIWWTTTACGDLTSGNFAAVPGSPTLASNSLNRGSMSDDGVLYVVENVNNNDYVYRFTHSSASGLPTDTWTQITGIFGGGNLVMMCEPDPFNAGKVCYMNGGAFYRTATGYGSTLGTLNASPNIVAGDTPWIAAAGVSMGGGEWSRLTPNLMTFTDGVGTLKFTPNNTGTSTDMSGYMQANQSWIPVHMVKCPSPNGNLIATGQDRSYVCWTNTQSDPGGYFPSGLVVLNGGFVDYAQDNPTITYYGFGTVYRNTAGGVVASMGSGINPFRTLGNNPFSTVSTSPTVTVTSTSHGFSNGDRVGFTFASDANNVLINNNIFTVTVVNANSYTITASTNANATSSFGGGSVQEGARGWTGGGYGNLSAQSTKILVVPTHGFGGPNMIQYGSSSNGGTTWDWQQTQFNPGTGAAPLLGYGGSWSAQSSEGIKPISYADSVVWYMDIGSAAYANTLFKSTDFGATLTCPHGTTGSVISTWSGYTGWAQNMQMVAVPGNANHVLVAQGVTGGATNNSPLRRTRDGGATWEDMGNTQKAYGIARGPGVTGNSYGSFYMVGRANGDANTRMYRCDNMSSSSTTCTWIPQDNILKANVDFGGSFAGVYADQDTAGRFWFMTQDTGIVEGHI